MHVSTAKPLAALGARCERNGGTRVRDPGHDLAAFAARRETPPAGDDLEHAGDERPDDDDDEEARVFELAGHPFYLATLFVPQTCSTTEKPHPLVTALLAAGADSGHNQRQGA